MEMAYEITNLKKMLKDEINNTLVQDAQLNDLKKTNKALKYEMDIHQMKMGI
jgi:hypothetical protein